MENKIRSLQGTVVAKSGKNTIKVRVERKQLHPMYSKVMRTHKTYLADCSAQTFESIKIGEVVTIGETSKVSKSKSWRILNTK